MDPAAAVGWDKYKVFRPLYNLQLMRDLDSPLALGYEVFAQNTDGGLFQPMLRRTREDMRVPLAEVRLLPMTGKYQELYAVLQAIQYELPTDSSGCPLPPEQLLLNILDEDDDHGDEKELLPPAPVENGQTTRRLGRGPVGAGMR